MWLGDSARQMCAPVLMDMAVAEEATALVVVEAAAARL